MRSRRIKTSRQASSLKFLVGLSLLAAVLSARPVAAQTANARALSGVVVSDKNELVAGATIIVRAASSA